MWVGARRGGREFSIVYFRGFRSFIVGRPPPPPPPLPDSPKCSPEQGRTLEKKEGEEEER